MGTPQETCQLCGNPSGRKPFLTELKGPSEAHRNNIFPTSIEYESLLENIALADSEIAHLDEEIARLQQSIVLLKDRKEAVLNYKTQEQSRFAPIRRIPQEILRHIFFQLHLDASTSSYYQTDGYNRRICKSYVRVITQVSAYWRSSAFSYPLLWTRLLAICLAGPKDVTVIEPFTEKSTIELSQNLPLSDVRIMTNDRQRFTKHRAHNNLTNIIAQSIPRWRSLCCKSTEFLSTYTAFPRLTTLELRSMRDPITLSSVPELKEIKICLSTTPISVPSAPLLTSLELIDSGPRAVRANFPLSQITHFKSEMCYYNYGELTSALLEEMPKLTVLNFSGDTRAIAPILLPQLHTLTLGGTNPGRRGDRTELASFTTPNLTSLTLCGMFEIAELLEFLERSGCHCLEELSIKPVFLGDYLGAVGFSYIKKLKLSCVRFNHSSLHDVMFWLSSREARLDWERLEEICGLGRRDCDTMFPRLEILHLEGIPFGYFASLSGILTMLSSRLPSPSARGDSIIDAPLCSSYLKSATIIFGNELEDDVVQTLKTFLSSSIVQQPGVQVTVGYIANSNSCVPDFL